MVSVILNILLPDYGIVINPHTLHTMFGKLYDYHMMLAWRPGRGLQATHGV